MFAFVALLAAGIAALVAGSSGSRSRPGRVPGPGSLPQPSTVFPGVSDDTAFAALGMQRRAFERCPDDSDAIADIGEAFARDAQLSDEAPAFNVFQSSLRMLCGIEFQSGDVELGRVVWSEIGEA